MEVDQVFSASVTSVTHRAFMDGLDFSNPILATFGQNLRFNNHNFQPI